MGNTGCVMVDGYCIHCRRPDHLQATDDYKCPGSATIPVAQTAIERWSQEPAVQDVLHIMDCGPWEPGRWDDICGKCRRASGGLSSILEQRDLFREGLEKAIELLEYDCPDCVDKKDAQVAKLKKILSSK